MSDVQDKILDFIYDEMSPGAREAFERELAEEPELAAQVASMQALRSGVSQWVGAPSPKLGEGALDAIMAEAAAELEPAPAVPTRRWGRQAAYPVWAAAAALILVSGVALWAWRGGGTALDGVGLEEASVASELWDEERVDAVAVVGAVGEEARQRHQRLDEAAQALALAPEAEEAEEAEEIPHIYVELDEDGKGRPADDVALAAGDPSADVGSDAEKVTGLSGRAEQVAAAPMAPAAAERSAGGAPPPEPAAAPKRAGRAPGVASTAAAPRGRPAVASKKQPATAKAAPRVAQVDEAAQPGEARVLLDSVLEADEKVPTTWQRFERHVAQGQWEAAERLLRELKAEGASEAELRAATEKLENKKKAAEPEP